MSQRADLIWPRDSDRIVRLLRRGCRGEPCRSGLEPGREVAEPQDRALSAFRVGPSLDRSHPHDERNGPPELLAKYGAVNHTDQDNPPLAHPKQPKLPPNYLPAHPFNQGQPGGKQVSLAVTPCRGCGDVVVAVGGGMVTDVVAADFETCRGHTAYLCGPPPMVEAALKTALLATGKRKVIAFEAGYHGLGYGALNATHRAWSWPPGCVARITRAPMAVQLPASEAMLWLTAEGV